jgi:signal transduction histidine kinase
MFTESKPPVILYSVVDVTNLEKQEQEKIEFPPRLTQALGSYLNQEIAPQLTKIDESIRSLPENSQGIEAMKNGKERIEQFLDSMETAGRVSFATGNYEFRFLGRRKEKALRPGVITADQKLTHTLVNGLDHVIRNPLSSLRGYSELNNYPKIHRASSKILQVIDLFNNACELRITIDKSGRPTLKTIPQSTLAR